MACLLAAIAIREFDYPYTDNFPAEGLPKRSITTILTFPPMLLAAAGGLLWALWPRKSD